MPVGMLTHWPRNQGHHHISSQVSPFEEQRRLLCHLGFSSRRDFPVRKHDQLTHPGVLSPAVLLIPQLGKENRKFLQILFWSRE